MLEWIASPEAWVTLTMLEIVLFSVFVEMLNMRVRGVVEPVDLRSPYGELD